MTSSSAHTVVGVVPDLPTGLLAAAARSPSRSVPT